MWSSGLRRWLNAAGYINSLCSHPRPPNSQRVHWSEMLGAARLCFVECLAAVCLLTDVRTLAFLPVPLSHLVLRTPHPWMWSSWSWVRVMPPIFVGGPKKGLFHIMLHKPALNLGGRAISRWTHRGPLGFSNMAAPPAPPVHAKH